MMRAIVLVFALLATAPAHAQPNIEHAKQLYETATSDYKLGKFDQALAGYEAAYKLYAAPAFLFNIAQCHFQLGHWDRAVFFFEGYLRDVPDATNRQLVEELIKDARARETAAREAEARRLELERQRLEFERNEKQRQREAQERAQLAVVQPRVEAPPERPVYKKWWFWTVVGGAVAGAATTLLVTSGDRTVLPSGSLGTLDQR